MLYHGPLLLIAMFGLVSSFPSPFGVAKLLPVPVPVPDLPNPSLGVAKLLPVPVPVPDLPNLPSPSLGVANLLPVPALPNLPNLPIPSLPLIPGIPSLAGIIMDKLGLTAILRFLGLLPSISLPLPEVKDIMPNKPRSTIPQIPGAAAVGSSPSDMQDLDRRLRRLEAVLKLEGKIQMVGDKMMVTNGKEVDFETSSTTCNEVGGRIVTPRTEEENTAVLEIAKKYNRYVYLGMKQGSVPGIFNDLNGVPAVYTKWRKGEPSGKATEGCVEMYTDGQWNDKACNQNRLTVCEL